ncbi:Uncharacterized protein Adt_16278 [Abeliophyllum distichum]|uniref:Uncharacterized protein n=1 Tax=Abeliophyllum distichum TaxID=126358 RepID=A0ABD1TDQ6_9LAMI
MEYAYVVEETLLETHEDRAKDEVEGENEDELRDLSVQFSDSEDEVNDGDFQYDKNAPERITVGLNSDPIIEEAHEAAIKHETDLDHSYDPSFEELHTDYSIR